MALAWRSIRDRDQDIWIWDLARRTLTRLTDAPGADWYPLWTPDSRRVIYASARVDGPNNNNLFWQAADNSGPVERLTESPNRQGPASISADGSRLIVMENTPKTGWDLGVQRLEDTAGSSGATSQRPRAAGFEPLVQTAATEIFGELSPDAHWLAYQSDESGQNEVWVRPFPNVDGGKWQVSTTGGITPVWSRNGTELIYFDGTNAVTSVPIQTAPTFSAGPPIRLFDREYVASPFWRTYDVSRDRKRFLMVKDNDGRDPSSAASSIVVVLNWLEELKLKVPALR